MKKILIFLILLIPLCSKAQFVMLYYQPSNTDWNWKLTATGTGVGVSTLQLTVNHNTTLVITANGTFCTSGGTPTAQTVSVVTGSTQTVYLTVSSGTCLLSIKDGQRYCTKINTWTSSTNAASAAFNINTMPPVLTYFYVAGSNTISGTIPSFPSGMTYFYVIGSNTISGTIPAFPAGCNTFFVVGLNTISGTIPAFPAGFTYFYVAGSNTISGTIPAFPAGFIEFYVGGSNTISGTIPAFPAWCIEFNVGGSNTINAYTNSFSTSVMNTVYFVPGAGGGLSANDCANLIIALDGITWSGSTRTLYLKGTNATPTPSSALTAALLDLTTNKSVTVSTN